MKPSVQALLVADRNYGLLTIECVLDALDVKTTRVRDCAQAESRLCNTPPPHVVITEPVLSDGNWMDLLDIAAKAKEKVNLVVVSPFVDVNLYVDVINCGGFDFILESFTFPEIAHVLRSAVDSAVRARNERSLSSQSPERLVPVS